MAVTSGQMALLQAGLGALKGAQNAPDGQWVDLGYGRRAFVPNKFGGLAAMLGGAAEGGMSELSRRGMVDEAKQLQVDQEARRDAYARGLLGLQDDLSGNRAREARDWQSAENKAGRDFTFSNAEADRSIRREESALDRLMKKDALDADTAYKSRYLDALTAKAEKKSMTPDEVYAALMQNDYAEGKSPEEADARARGYVKRLFPGWGQTEAPQNPNPLTPASDQQNSILQKLQAVPQILKKNVESSDRWKRQQADNERMFDGLWRNGVGIGGF